MTQDDARGRRPGIERRGKEVGNLDDHVGPMGSEWLTGEIGEVARDRVDKTVDIFPQRPAIHEPHRMPLVPKV